MQEEKEIIYKKVSVEKELPKEDGKYVVFTRTNFLKQVNTFKTSYKDSNGKPSWGCTNQVVTHWLKEITD